MIDCIKNSEATYCIWIAYLPFLFVMSLTLNTNHHEIEWIKQTLLLYLVSQFTVGYLFRITLYIQPRNPSDRS